MHVAAVIPNWNGLRFLQSLFRTLQAQSRAFDSVLVVDGGSTDGSAEWVVQAGATVLQLGENRGFAVAVNAGVNHVSQMGVAQFVAIVNNDLELESDWLERMLAGMGDAPLGTGKVLSVADPERIDGAWDCVSRAGAALRCGSGRRDGTFWNQAEEVMCAPFTAVMLRPEVFRELGGLDEAFGSYLEDVEFGLRCGRAGLRWKYVPGAVCRHVGGGTLGQWSARMTELISRNQMLLVARHGEMSWSVVMGQALWGVVAASRGQFGSWLRGKWAGIRVYGAHKGEAAPGEVWEQQEAEIRRVQRATGVDSYWRLYFWLTGRRL